MNKRISLRRKIRNIGFIIFCWFCGLLSISILGEVLYSLLKRSTSLSINMFLHDTHSLGLRNAVIGTLIMSIFAIVIATPIGILIATYMTEVKPKSKFTSVVRFINDMLMSTPSIVAGVFIYVLIVSWTRFSAISGVIVLIFIAIPVIVRMSEDILNMVSPMLKEAAIALGIPRWRVTVMIVYKAAKNGLVTAMILALARIMGESAPLLFTSAKNSFLSFDPTNAMESLPVMIYENAMQPYDELQNMAWAGALVITSLVLFLNLLARYIARKNTL